MTAEHAGYWICGVWYVTWWIPALWSQKAAGRPPRGTANLDRLITGLGAFMVFAAPPPGQSRASPFAPLWTAPAAVTGPWWSGSWRASPSAGGRACTWVGFGPGS